jgi:acyl-homoserine lactone acylase PvdQ
MLIGRGEDFANTLTSASGDIVDQYAEKLCGGSDTRYRYKGKCREMGTFDAGTLNGDPVSFRTTVHGPVVAYADVDGKKVAISSKRSTIGRETLDLLFNRKLSNGSIRNPKDFYRAANKSPQTFNSFFIDDKRIAAFTTGRLPERPKSVDPGLLTNGNGRYEWRGFIGRDAHPHGADPRDGTIVNWNQIMAPGFASADNEWGRNGSVGRVDLLRKNMRRLSKTGKFSLKTLVAAMNAAGTQDIRAIDTVPLLAKLLRGSKAPSARAKQMLNVLVDWNKDGGSRLDRENDGLADHPGVAVMDGSWNRIADAFMRPRIGSQKLLDELDALFPRFDQPPEKNQYAGWYQYFDRDIKGLLGIDQPDPFNNAYCGKGRLKACQRSIWRALDRSGNEIAQGGGDPSSWREEADVLKFKPLNLKTIRYTNRPSGLQQVISFDGHRPRK